MKLHVANPQLTSMREKAVPILERLSRGDTIEMSLLVMVGMTVSELDFNGSRIGLMVDESAFESCNLARTDLTGMHLRDSALRDVSFESADLVKSEIYRCSLEQVSFENCNLNRAEITECRLGNVNFNGATLIGASFDECDLRGVNIHEAVLQGTYFFGCLLDESTQRLPGVILKDAIA